MTEAVHNQPNSRTGGCLCQGVRYRVDGPFRDVLNCHCERCRRTSGHHVAATRVVAADITFAAKNTLRWYRPDDDPSVRYGFCHRCGSSLFWMADDSSDRWSVCAGTLDDAAGLTTIANWFAEVAGCYFDLDPNVEAITASGSS